MINYSSKSMTEQAIAIQENLITPTKLLENFFENIKEEGIRRIKNDNLI